MATLIIFFVIIIFLLIGYFSKRIVSHIMVLYCIHKMPGPPTHNLLTGNVRLLHDTPDVCFSILRKWATQFYPIYKIWVGPLGAVNILVPEDMALILGDTKHLKKSLIYNVVRRWLNEGLVTSYGDKWVQRRKILTPTFHFTILQDFVPTFNERTHELVHKLKEDCDKPYTEINDVIINLTLKIITETAMGKKLEFNNHKESEYKSALHELGQIVNHRTFKAYLLYDWIYIFTTTFFKELKLLKILHGFTNGIITQRELNFSENADLTKKKRMAMLDLLLTAKRQTGVIDDPGIREEVDTFMFAGHDTISSALCSGFMLIACHPRIQDEIVQEMREVLGDIKRKPDYNQLQELKYMERCIKEVLRLYPSAPYISRMTGEDIITHTGYKIKKNTIVQLHVYDLHHNPEIYPNPEKFDPDRFLPENCKTRHPYAYIPFSAGPRNCIGQRFAMLEIKAVLCGILGNFVLEAVDTPETIIPIVDIVFRTKEKIKVKFVIRD